MRASPRRLSFLPLLAVVFFNVSGGPYGIEDAVSVFGPGLTLALLALTPLLVALPVALAVASAPAAFRVRVWEVMSRGRVATSGATAAGGC